MTDKPFRYEQKYCTYHALLYIDANPQQEKEYSKSHKHWSNKGN